VKQDGRREPFNEEKLRNGMLRALERRAVETDLVEEAIHRIKREAMTTGEREIKSRRIGEWVMRELRGLDQVAYVRFASVYRSFEDVQAFRDLIERLEKDLTPEMLKSQMPLLGDEPSEKH
jgi:transcriptional repressor NrdR